MLALLERNGRKKIERFQVYRFLCLLHLSERSTWPSNLSYDISSFSSLIRESMSSSGRRCLLLVEV